MDQMLFELTQHQLAISNNPVGRRRDSRPVKPHVRERCYRQRANVV
jgi:hypothetical protein